MSFYYTLFYLYNAAEDKWNIISSMKAEPVVKTKRCLSVDQNRKSTYLIRSIVPVRNFRWAMVASLFTCAYTISFHSWHDSPVPPN